MNKGIIVLIGVILTAVFCSLITYFIDNESMAPIYIGVTVFVISMLTNTINKKKDEQKDKNK